MQRLWDADLAEVARQAVTGVAHETVLAFLLQVGLVERRLALAARLLGRQGHGGQQKRKNWADTSVRRSLSGNRWDGLKQILSGKVSDLEVI